tara:strand:+ start:873 stop:1295 length:423 start_codon:yes stop_codon:yes gene_type:complete
MELFQILHTAALFLIALIIGGMAFFAAIMTPMVFAKLPPETSGPFIREVFPVYSKVMAVLTLLATLLLWGQNEAMALAVVFVLFIWAWIWLMPKINQFRDAELGGNKQAGRTFNLLHKLSVFINIAQLSAVSMVFIRIIS